MANRTDNEHYIFERVEAQRSATLIQLGALVIAALCITGAAFLQSPINAQRKELELVTNSNIYEGLPPRYAWVSAAGATFRGLAADVLWSRLEELKQAGKYYEAHQLAKWICTVQPRFPSVWEFQAWNMSYNISVGTKTKEERWLWVYNGIRLLRDEGIPHNEKCVPLYHQLAWTIFHKIGDTLDDYHMWYKRLWASKMQILLGEPPIVATDAAKIAQFRKIAESPASYAALIEKQPGVQPIVDKLNDAGIDVEIGTNTSLIWHPLEDQFFPIYTRWSILKETMALRSRKPTLTESEQTLHTVFDEAKTEDLDALLNWMRAKVLREQYKMDPTFMLQMSNELYSKEPLALDWRTPWAHSMYWAMYGVAYADPDHEIRGFRSLLLDRIVTFNMQKLVKEGKFILRLNVDQPFESHLNMLSMTNNALWIDALNKMYIAMGPKYADEGENVENRTADKMRSGHVNFLHAGIIGLYLAGDEAKAAEYMTYLAQYYPDPITKQTQAQYMTSVAEFVRKEFNQLRDNYADTIITINSILYNAFVSAATLDMKTATRSITLAGDVLEDYQTDKRTDPMDRRRLPEFPRFMGNSLAQVVGDQSFGIVSRSSVWLRVDQLAIDDASARRAKQWAYLFVADTLRQECELYGYDFDRAFPEPEGMEAFMKEVEAETKAKSEEASIGTGDQ